MVNRAEILNTDNLDVAYGAHLAKVIEDINETLRDNEFRALVFHSGTEVKQPGRDITTTTKPHPDFTRIVGGVYSPSEPISNGTSRRFDQTPGNAVVFAEGAEKPKLFVHSNPEDPWHLQANVPDSAAEHFDVVVVPTPGEVMALIRSEFSRSTAFVGDTRMPGIDYRRDLRALPHFMHATERVLNQLEWLKRRKTPYELKCITAATRRAVVGHEAIREAFENDPDVVEFQLRNMYLGSTNHTVQDSPYPPIVAIGPGSTVLHNFEPTTNHIAANNVLTDAGAEANGISCDITTDYVREGVVPEFRETLAGLETIQSDLSSLVVPGVEYGELTKQMYVKVAELLIEVGFVQNCSVEDAVALQIPSAFITHSIGHTMGSHVHEHSEFVVDKFGNAAKPYDDPAIQNSYPRRALEADEVLTIEPGIYFNPQKIRMALSKLDEKDGKNRISLINWGMVHAASKEGGMRLESDVAASDEGAVDITKEFLSRLTNA